MRTAKLFHCLWSMPTKTPSLCYRAIRTSWKRMTRKLLRTSQVNLVPLLTEYLAQGYVSGFAEEIRSYLQWLAVPLVVSRTPARFCKAPPHVVRSV